MVSYEAVVPKDLKDLVPAFLKNRKAEIEALDAALKVNDLVKVKQIGERIYSIGEPYGFSQISAIGKNIQEAAKVGDVNALSELKRSYQDYLSTVRVNYK